jgi:hypothetical protein
MLNCMEKKPPKELQMKNPQSQWPWGFCRFSSEGRLDFQRALVTHSAGDVELFDSLHSAINGASAFELERASPHK